MMEMQFQQTAQKRTTAGNIAFLVLSFPLGLFYFLLTVIGLAIGMSTTVLWVGLPVLFATLVVIRGMAEVERRVVTSLLHIHVPVQHDRHNMPQRGFLRRFGSILRDPLTWTSTIYMILKFPLGIFSFVLALVLPIVSIAILALPLVYLVNLFINGILLMNGIHSMGIIIPYYIEVDTHFDLVMFARTFIGIPIGLGLWFITRSLLNGLALLSGEIARALLGTGEVDLSMSSEQVWSSSHSYQEHYPSQVPGNFGGE